MIRLQLNLKDQPLGRYDFPAEAQVVVGRQPGCALHINDPGVSREHCRLSHQAGRGWVLEDLGSSNGTYLNRRRLESPQAVHDEDVISVGTFTLVVTTGSPRAKAEETVGWRLTPESAEASASRKAHLQPAAGGEPPVLIQRDALRLGSAARCEVRLSGAPALLAVLIRGYGGFQLLNAGEDPAAVHVNGAPVADRCWLRDEDRLELGGQTWTFHAGLPSDSFGTVQMNVADLGGLLDG